jgi:hypothetical protein
LTDPAPHTEPPGYWARSESVRWNQRDVPPLHRFLGGSPLGVVLRLVVVSLIVGALLVWLDIRPAELLQEVIDLSNRLWTLGFRSLRDIAEYLVAGAAIVVPVWFVVRLLSYRRT